MRPGEVAVSGLVGHLYRCGHARRLLEPSASVRTRLDGSGFFPPSRCWPGRCIGSRIGSSGESLPPVNLAFTVRAVDNFRGIATLDRPDPGGPVSVWITSNLKPSVTSVGADEPDKNRYLVASHGNAVTGASAEQVHTLTRCAAVLLTPGSTAFGLGLVGAPLEIEDLDDLIDATAEHRERLAAVFRAKKRKQPLWPTLPERPTLPEETTARTLAVADYLARAWTAWLQTDSWRVKKVTAMPDDLATPLVTPRFPPAFAERLTVQGVL